MTVHLEQVGPSIVVEVEEGIAPAHIGHSCGGDACNIRNIRKTHLPIVPEQCRVFVAEMRNREREESSVLIIAESQPHVGLLGPILVDGHPRHKSYVGKVAGAVVAVQIVGLTIIRNKKDETPIV